MAVHTVRDRGVFLREEQVSLELSGLIETLTFVGMGNGVDESLWRLLVAVG